MLFLDRFGLSYKERLRHFWLVKMGGKSKCNNNGG